MRWLPLRAVLLIVLRVAALRLLAGRAAFERRGSVARG
jgi:hypothetical protein